MSTINKLGLFVLVILCTSFVVDASYCYRICYVTCGYTYCYRTCYWYCNRRRRGTDPKNTEMKITPFPESFQEYDLDKNGTITLQELAKALDLDEHSKETKDAFDRVDVNKDGVIDCNEFQGAPFLFEHQPSC